MGSLVSLVMSDIVDSTRRWNAAEGAMAADLELHDRLIRDVVEGAGGSVFKHTGDGMIAVFDDPVAAAGAAAGIQQAIGIAQWQQPDGLRVRAAVHTGVVYPRDGDLFGTAVNKVARLLGVCPPGAVLVSGATAALLTDRAPEGVVVEAVGDVALAGFSTPEPVHALSAVGVVGVDRVVAAPMRRRSGELPRIDDELVGRTEELATIWEALGRARLVTLVGVGGMGKTRLALEVAAGGVDTFAGGAWWIDLATATTADAVVPVALAAVEAQETAGRTPTESFCDRLAGSSALLVFDNCEHLLPTVFALVDALLSAAPLVRVVATSREALGVRGEQLVPIGSLPTNEGVALFAERALALRPDLDLAANHAVIERICHRLDGIPLAIELAAARCRSMMPAEIDDLLDDRFRLLRGGRAGAERHRTLQATVAWSYSLLDADERAVFDQLAVFAGGSLIDGLTAVTGLDRFDLLDIVDRLVARSMVVATATALGTRYHQLETLRQFAEDRLVEAGTIDEIRSRHLLWVHGLGAMVASCEGTPRSGDAFRRVCAEVDNIRMAVAHANASGRRQVAYEIVAPITFVALSRPMFEMLDSVRPIEMGDDWTDAAAECAAGGALADFYRGNGFVDGPIGGVPERFLTSNRRVRLASLIQRSFYGRAWRQVLDILASTPTSDALARIDVDRIWLLTQYGRQVYGGPEAAIGPDEFAEIRRRGSDALDATRSLGDEVAYCQIAIGYSLVLELVDPEESMKLSTDLLAAAARLGANWQRDFALARYFRCLAYLAARGRALTPDAVLTLRTTLVDVLAGGNPPVSLALSSAALLAPHDPDTAIKFFAVYRRYTGVEVTGFLERAGLPTPADWTEYERRATGVSLIEAIVSLVAALDRLITQPTDGST